MSDRCPLCDEPNECQMAAGLPNAGTCWCSATRIPADLLDQVAPPHRGMACICARCVAEHAGKGSVAQPGDRCSVAAQSRPP